MTLLKHEIVIRVRYNETDGQSRVHHAQYLNYFERGRVEMMRSMGFSYKSLEASGLMLVVRKMEIDYIYPAEFDDELVLETVVRFARGARIRHGYVITRQVDNQQIVTANSEIACVDRSGAVRRLPDYLQS